MKSKTITGFGRLHDGDNAHYIRDVDYNITEIEGVPTLTGRLYGIEWQALNDMSGNDYVLYLRGGQTARITILELTNGDLPDSCRFQVNSFLED